VKNLGHGLSRSHLEFQPVHVPCSHQEKNNTH
jgi:hypothetical protein